MRRENGRGQTGIRRTMQTGKTRDMPTVRVVRALVEQGAGGGGFGAGENRGRMRRSVQRGWRRMGFRRQFLMLLVTATLLSTLGTVAAAYLGARVAAISNAQSRIQRDLTVAEQVMQAHGPSLAVQAGQLYTADGTLLNSDQTVARQMATLTGDATALYQLENGQFVDIAGSMTSGPVNSAIGQPLTGPAARALLHGCQGAHATPCRVTYSGVMSMQGVSYIAGLAPLNDDQGHLVGALGVVTPLAAIDTPLRELAGLLLLVGLLLTGIFIVLGYRISGPVSRRACNRLSQGLDDVSMAAGQLEQMSRRQLARSEHQVAAAQDIVAELRKLSDLAEALEHGTNLLRESTGQLWAEMSYPAPEAPRSLAASNASGGSPAMRQTAVVASQIGAAAGQARVLCHSLRTRLNQIIAEAGLLSDESLDVDVYIDSLASAVQCAEQALDSQPASTSRDFSVHGFVRALRGGVLAATVGSQSDDADDFAAGPPPIESGQTLRSGGSSGEWPARSAARGNALRAPRPRSGYTNPPLNAHTSGVFHAMPHPVPNSGPHASGSHPSVSGRRRVPWYSDEQDLSSTAQERDVPRRADARTNPPVPPGPQSGSWRRPPADPRSGPQSGSWMNDAR